MIDEKRLIEEIKEIYTEEFLKEYGFDKLVEAQPKAKYPLSDCEGDCKSCWNTKLVNGTNAGSKWIPCSERLPNDIAIHEVTAKFSNGTIYTEFAYYDESREEWWKFDDDGIVNVIAWKEHSEPYKEGET